MAGSHPLEAQLPSPARIAWLLLGTRNMLKHELDVCAQVCKITRDDDLMAIRTPWNTKATPNSVVVRHKENFVTQ